MKKMKILSITLSMLMGAMLMTSCGENVKRSDKSGSEKDDSAAKAALVNISSTESRAPLKRDSSNNKDDVAQESRTSSEGKGQIEIVDEINLDELEGDVLILDNSESGKDQSNSNSGKDKNNSASKNDGKKDSADSSSLPPNLQDDWGELQQ